MNCKIFLDTNLIYTDKEESLREVFNNNIPKLHKFIKENKLEKDVSVCLPEIVFKERLQHKVENINSAINIVNNNITKLIELGHKSKNIKAKKDYLKQLKIEANIFLKKYDVSIIPVPKIESDELIQRAIHKIKPFKKAGEGFKDTLIFLTLIDNAIKEGLDIYILCTHNLSDFSDDIKAEFKEKTNKELVIIPSIIELEEKLDSIFTLRLKRKERDEIIKNTISKKIGELMIFINKNSNYKHKNTHNPYLLTSLSDRISLSDFSFVTDENNIMGYDFNEIDINNIEEKDKNNFKVNLTIKTNIRYEDEVKNIYETLNPTSLSLSDSQYSVLSSFNQMPGVKNFKVDLNCNIETGQLKINSTRLY